MRLLLFLFLLLIVSILLSYALSPSICRNDAGTFFVLNPRTAKYHKINTSNVNPLDAVIEVLTSAEDRLLLSLSRTETYECSIVSTSMSKPEKARLKENNDWTDLKQHPTTFLIISVNVAAFAYIKLYGVSPYVVTSSYDKIISEKDFKSVITSTYSHVEIWHICCNLSSFLSFRAIMESRGSNGPVDYFKLIFALTFLSSAVELVIIEMLTR